jgi:hypothetical protein
MKEGDETEGGKRKNKKRSNKEGRELVKELKKSLR